MSHWDKVVGLAIRTLYKEGRRQFSEATWEFLLRTVRRVRRAALSYHVSLLGGLFFTAGLFTSGFRLLAQWEQGEPLSFDAFVGLGLAFTLVGSIVMIWIFREAYWIDLVGLDKDLLKSRGQRKGAFDTSLVDPEELAGFINDSIDKKLDLILERVEAREKKPSTTPPSSTSKALHSV